jgi:hypothetical protein
VEVAVSSVSDLEVSLHLELHSQAVQRRIKYLANEEEIEIIIQADNVRADLH